MAKVTKVIGQANRELAESRAIAGDKPKFLISRSGGKEVVQLRKAVYKMAYLAGALGDDIMDLAKKLGVKKKALIRWMDGDEEIVENYRRGLDKMAIQIEATAYKKAKGYEAQRRVVCTQRDGRGNVVMKTTTNTTEHIQPDGGMLKYLLRHRGDGRFGSDDDTNRPQVAIYLDGDDAEI